MSPLGHRPPARRWTPLHNVPPRPRFSLWTFKGHTYIHTMHSNRNCIKSELVMVTVFHCIGKKSLAIWQKKLHSCTEIWPLYDYHMTYSSPTALL